MPPKIWYLIETTDYSDGLAKGLWVVQQSSVPRGAVVLRRFEASHPSNAVYSLGEGYGLAEIPNLVTRQDHDYWRGAEDGTEHAPSIRAAQILAVVEALPVVWIGDDAALRSPDEPGIPSA